MQLSLRGSEIFRYKNPRARRFCSEGNEFSQHNNKAKK